MNPPVPPEQLVALRALREGATPTLLRLAMAARLHPSTLRERSSREGWGKPADAPSRRAPADDDAPEGMPPEEMPAEMDLAAALPERSLEERLARMMDVLFREMEAIGAAAQARRRPLDKGRIDALGAMIRTLEKFEGFARERSREGQTGRDGEMADVLRRIDERIRELAATRAEELVAARIAAGKLVERERLGG